MNIRALSAFVLALLIHASLSLSTTSASSSSPTSDSPSTFPTTNLSMSQPPSNASTPFDLWTYLPSAWTTFCDVDYDVDTDVNATLRCNVTESDVWELKTLRDALGALVNSIGIEVAVDLQCQEEGMVSLPWPMRAPGLVKLNVTSCLLLDKYADFNTSAEQIPDSLRFLDMHDCVWLNYPDEVNYVIRNAKSVSSEFECGQDSTLVVYRYRRIADKDIRKEDECDPVMSSALQQLNYSLSFPEDVMELSQWTDEQFEEFVNNTKALGEDYVFCADHLTSFRFSAMNGEDPGPPSDVQTTTVDPNEDALISRIGLNKINTDCLYEHLEILDESSTVPLDRKHFEYLVENTEYPKLRVLNYSHTNLGEVPKELREWRVYFNKSPIELMDLSHNNITEVGNIPDYTNTHGNVTTTLNLQFNQIAKISFEMFEAWSQQPDFVTDIRNNPIDCSCDMLDLKDLVTQLQDDSKWAEQPMQTYRQHLSVMTCATPPALSGRVIESLSVEDLQCYAEPNEMLVPVVVVLVVVVLALSVLLILALKYRKEVRILLFTRVHVVLPCGPNVSSRCASEKVFDAFVAYAHQDSDWVLGSLLKRLEEPSNARGCGPVKLCIHQRDFVVGKPIIDNIIDSIAASRHTIIVLSKSFAKSSWAMEELQQAYRQSLEERRRHLLVVRLEEVPESDMAPVLRRCCKTFTYIEASDPLFWDRLQYSLHVAGDKKTLTSTSAEFDNVTFTASEDKTLDKHSAVQMETPTGDINDNSGFSKTEVFCEDMKTLPVDTTSSTTTRTVSETYRRVNPDEVKVDFS
uniref:Toll-like receptor 6.1 n=1 Tax=Littorina littorea TaxID=31216 RepID=A0A7G8Z9Z8_LITLI|nr:toll-like receptor 6.1 [Littorina littorea]